MDLQPRIDSMPVEVIEEILSQLALPDICSLRLAGRKLNARSSQGIFKSYFRSKTIMMGASEQLHQAVQVTQGQGFGCFLEHLTLVGPKRPDNEEESSMETALLILFRQFMEDLGLNVAGGCLQSMSITVNNEDRTTGSDWEAAAKCFEHTMLALHANQLPIKSLDVFWGVKRCRLSIDQLPTILELNLSASLQHLKCLSMSLSHHVAYEPGRSRVPTSEPKGKEMRALATGKRNTDALCKFLQCCPVLEDLQFHWYKLYLSKLSHASNEEQRFFNRVAKSCQFPFLKRCTLKGIETSQTALLSFLRQVQLNSIVMEEVRLRTGKFGPVFDYLVERMEQLEYLHFDNLRERDLIYFDAPGKPHFCCPGMGPNALTRSGTDARMPIKYRFYNGSMSGEIEVTRWIIKRQREYGPR
ncbi:hypothetical protein V495_00116 [Pseudogymnoascus sp. VKM F-4514 (FW-929)]|nr:hypothetical protein V495_00116 [Pseudogymnoascus sp. VKM F-4514 (FW-929)]KFY67583.1 hypothetical protein V497_00284 [Pseudogymnoascus sp. VKM F-4516 (FW-969)]